MINHVKAALKFALRPAARVLTASQPKIIMYHRFSRDDGHRAVTVERFRRQVEILKENFTLLTMRELVRRSLSPPPANRHLAAITVDDGYEDFYTHAFPVLREFEVPATIFVTGGFVSRELWLWPDLLRAVIENSYAGRYQLSGFWRGKNIGWSDEVGREATWSTLADRLLSESTRARFEAIQSLARTLGVDMEALDMSPYKPLNWNQLRELDTAGIEIGDHTWTHCNVAQQPRAALSQELNKSRKAIQENVGCTVTGLAYPNGMPSDYDSASAQTVSELGYEYAVVAHPRRFDSRRVYEIGRLDGSSEIATFRNIIAGFQLLRQRPETTYQAAGT